MDGGLSELPGLVIVLSEMRSRRCTLARREENSELVMVECVIAGKGLVDQEEAVAISTSSPQHVWYWEP